LIRSVWLSDCGELAVDMFRWIPRGEYKSVKKLPVNVESLSETMSCSKPWYFHTLSNYDLATFGESFFLSSIKCAISKYQSTTTRMTVSPSDTDMPVLQSVLLCVHGVHGNSSGWRNPCIACLGALLLWHLSHSLQYVRISRTILGQYKFLEINSNVHSVPKCPANFESCFNLITLGPIPSVT